MMVNHGGYRNHVTLNLNISFMQPIADPYLCDFNEMVLQTRI